MGVFDMIKGMLGGGQGDAVSGMAGVVGALLSPENGGLQGLVEKFQGAGLGEMIQGWISTGPNPAVSGEQIQAALGSDMVSSLAEKAGMDPGALLGQLSTQLPALVDKLTPDGVMPDLGALQANLGGVLGGLFGGKG